MRWQGLPHRGRDRDFVMSCHIFHIVRKRFVMVAKAESSSQCSEAAAVLEMTFFFHEAVGSAVPFPAGTVWAFTASQQNHFVYMLEGRIWAIGWSFCT